MKKSKTIIVIVVAIVLLGIFFFSSKKNLITPNNQYPIVVAEDPIVGCYVVAFEKDVYTLTILSQQSELFKGTLVFKNFQKDSSSGTFEGTYKNGILFGDYSFQSEGMNSVMQVIFKKSGSDFIRGYGAINAEGNRFTDLNSITYNQFSPLAVFKAYYGDCATSL